MTPINPIFNACAGCPLNRRNFLLRGGAAVAGAVGALALPGVAADAPPAGRPRVRIVFALHGAQQDRPDWPNKGYDFAPAMARVERELARRCREVDFVSSQAAGEEDAKKLLAADLAGGGIAGYVVYQMNCWNRVVQTFANSGKPVLYADFQFGGSGGFLVYNAGFLRARTPNVGFAASSRLADVARAVNCFTALKQGGSVSEFVAATAKARRLTTPAASGKAGKTDEVKCLGVSDCVNRLKEAKVLAVRGQESGPAGEIAGVKIQHVPFTELNEAWQNADKAESRQIAEQWARAARRVDGVSRETLETSAAMYLAEKALLKKHGANAITINCLGGFYGGHIHAYPCLGFHQLLNEGLIGGCECDVRSAATMVIGTTLTQGRPGYISDPVIDTSKRQIIYAHCVASNRPFGPAGAANPFEILTHSEDRQGASVRSLLPVGFMTTSLEFEASRKEVLFHRALAVGNDPDDRACRTKLCGEPVGDIEKLFGMWDQWGWHRVTFYGDLKEPIYALADALGWKVVEEA